MPGLGLATEEVSAGPPRKLRDVIASKLILDWSPEQDGSYNVRRIDLP